MWPLVKVGLAIVLVLTVPLHFATLLILFIYKLFVLLLAKLLKDYVGFIPGSNYIFLPDLTVATPSSSIVVAVELEGKVELSTILEKYELVYNYRDDKGERCYRELAYYPVIFMGHGFWKEIAGFRPASFVHVVESSNIMEDGKSSPNSQNLVTRYTERLQKMPFKEGEPLWSIHIVHNFVCGRGGNEGQTLLLFRFHHLLADGMSFLKFFYAVTGSPKLPDEYTQPVESLKRWNKLRDSIFVQIAAGLRLATLGFVDYLYEFLVEKDRHMVNFDDQGNIKLTGEWRCWMGEKLDMERVKKASKQLKCSIVHVVLVGLNAGLENYLVKYHGQENLPQGFHYFIPFPTPGHPDMRFVNHWCLAKLHSKTGTQSIPERLTQARAAIRRCAKESSIPVVSVFMFRYICGLFPVAIVEQFIRIHAASTVFISNMAGPADNDWCLGGARINDAYFWMPMPQNAMALGVAIISHNGVLRFCLTADKGCIPTKSCLENLSTMINNQVLEICEISERSVMKKEE